jgi:hypothetical protein
VSDATTLAIAIPVGTVLAAVVILGVLLQKRKVNQNRTPPVAPGTRHAVAIFTLPLLVGNYFPVLLLAMF